MEHQKSDPRQERRPYNAPVVVYEAPLEVRAGSPAGIPNLLDSLGAGGN